MKLVKTALVTAMLSTAAFTAQADTFDLGDVTYEPGFGISQNGTGWFEDNILFSLSTDAGVKGVLFNWSFENKGHKITDFVATLSEATTGVIGTMDITKHVTKADWMLDSGNYTLSLSGNYGEYGTYDIDAFAAPVPEPSVLGLMLGGLGLVGMMAYRGRKA